MLPPLPRRKIILYLPFLHEEYSMAIHTELHKTAISSSLYFSTLVINIIFSCLSLCRRHQHFLRPSTHHHLQHTISSLQSHYLLCLAHHGHLFHHHRQRHRLRHNHQQHQHQLHLLFLSNVVCPFTRTQTEQLYTLYQIFNIKLYFI
ncbi:unnamed protein product [Porites lobata]|uniref:Uncharacterized protein n=1 Tax=Porites lobata TaxID=104759 RepID=A0ABN8PYD1_9CNID|nr:unnamed protein product [Porites lobata]